MTPAERRDAIWGCLRFEDELTDDEIQLLYRMVQLPQWTTVQRLAVERILNRAKREALNDG